MHRFFLAQECFQAQEVSFPLDVARQMSAVLRLHPGSQVIGIDPQGMEHIIELLAVDKTGARGRIITRRPATGEPRTQLTLYLCLTHREKFEWMLQKCTELGAAGFVPVISSRSLVQRNEDVTNKLERWQRIIQEAAEQSARGRVPSICSSMHYSIALQHAGQNNDLLLIPWEREQSVNLHQAILARGNHPSPPLRLAAMIGPEGGFTEEEITMARATNFQPVTLGPRILRMETAAMAVTALILYELG